MSDERNIRIEKKIDLLVDRIGSIDVTLAQQHISLKEHIRRTNAIEAAQAAMRKDDIEPVKRHVAMVQGAFKLLCLIGIPALVHYLRGLFK